MRHLIVALAALGTAGPALAADQPACDGRPVIMVVSGPVHDPARLRAYGQALAASGLYPLLGGYYLNAPRAIEVFEGPPPGTDSLLMVRFPCLAHARAFWNSRAYQEAVKPLRLNPDAGTFTVRVYAEAELPAYMTGRVTPPAYTPAIPAIPLPEQLPAGDP